MSKKDKDKKENMPAENTEVTEKEDNSVKSEKPKKEKKPRKPVNKRKLKYGSLAAAITVIFVTIVVLTNVLVYSMTDRFGLKLDLTEQQIFEVTQETIDYLGTIENDVDIVVMASEDDLATTSIYTKQLAETVRKYAQYSQNISVEFVDMDKNPEKVSKYKELYSGDISESNVVVNCGDRIKVLTVYDLFEVSTNEYYQSYISGYNAESALTSAIMYVTDANPMTIALLAVESPTSVSQSISDLSTIFTNNGYEVVSVDPLLESLSPDDYDLVIIPAPLNDFTSTVIDKLSDFLYNNGNLGRYIFYIANYDQNSTPNLDIFLEEYGISIGNSYIFETNSNSAMNVPVYGLNNYVSASIASIANEEYEEGLANTSRPIVAPVSVPINLIYDTNNERETFTLLTTSETSALIPFDASSDFDISDAETGEQTVMAIGGKFIYDDDNNKVSSSIMAIGSAYMLDTMITADTSYNNAEFIINAVNKMTGKSNGITILTKSSEAETITITDGEMSNIKNVTVVIFPVIVIAIGFAVFIKRRNM